MFMLLIYKSDLIEPNFKLSYYYSPCTHVMHTPVSLSVLVTVLYTHLSVLVTMLFALTCVNPGGHEIVFKFVSVLGFHAGSRPGDYVIIFQTCEF